MTPRAVLLVVIGLLALSCGRRTLAPPIDPPTGPPPEQVEAVSPPARGVGILDDTPIWVQFVTALDTATADDRTVFFKVDTRRLPATLRWEAATRRLHIIPGDRLGLRQTYTVELAAALRFTDGTTLGRLHAWQFTTNSLRRVESPLPQHGRSEQSPFVALRWGGLTEGSAGALTYEIHAGSDSAAVTDPASPSRGIVASSPYVPRVRWRQDGPVWWSIHVRNAATGERLVGPAWRFTAFPADAAFDSVAVGVVDWNWLESNNATRQRCTEDSLVMGPTMVSTIRWNLGPPDTSVRLVGAAIDLTPRGATIPAVAGPSVWFATASFFGCAHMFPGPPSTDEVNGKLADAVVRASDRIRFSGDALTAHVEATRRLGGFYGYLFRAPIRRSYFGPGAGSESVRATLWLYTYRPPAPAPLAAGRADR